jgi:hypothetical protein
MANGSTPPSAALARVTKTFAIDVKKNILDVGAYPCGWSPSSGQAQGTAPTQNHYLKVYSICYVI